MSCVLDADKVQHKIRLQNIDAPEREQAFGTKSKDHLFELVAGKDVLVDYSKYDRYGRILGKVIVNGEDVNLEHVEASMAWHYKSIRGNNPPRTASRIPTRSSRPGGTRSACGAIRTRCLRGTTVRRNGIGGRAWSRL